jgi:hypothetical protein
MDRRGGVIEIFKRAALMALTAVTFAAFGSSAAVAGPLKNLERGIIVDIAGVDAVLYEVTENMYLVDGAGKPVGPEQAVARKAEASLAGWARIGTPLCPYEQMVTNLGRGTCAVTAEGLDYISLLTGQGTVDGTFAVVVQDDNLADGPEYVVMNGTFSGQMDLSIRPLGKVSGKFVSNLTGEAVPFCGTFRLPFSLNLWGKRENPRRGQPAYYMANDGRSVFPAVGGEKSLGMPTVRLELTFGSLCR